MRNRRFAFEAPVFLHHSNGDSASCVRQDSRRPPRPRLKPRAAAYQTSSRFGPPPCSGLDHDAHRHLQPSGNGHRVCLQDGSGYRAFAAAIESARDLARAVMEAQSPASMAVGSTRAPPNPTATAPALMKSAAFSRVTPPDGISLICGKGASTSLKYFGPPRLAGCTLT